METSFRELVDSLLSGTDLNYLGHRAYSRKARVGKRKEQESEKEREKKREREREKEPKRKLDPERG